MCLPVTPHKIEKEWKAFGLSCAVVQAREASYRCGYVRVPPNHPMFGKYYDDVDVSVHGGLTFAKIEPCTEHEDGQGYWFGFDCGHSEDALIDPNVNLDEVSSQTRKLIEIHNQFTFRDKHFWTEAEVIAETEKLAEQLAALN